MFTGIIEEIGYIKNITHKHSALLLTIACHKIATDLKTGDSISVNGVCLSVKSSLRETFTTDVSLETLRTTNFNVLKVSSMVNLERSLRLSDRVGGHLITGHIDGIGTIIKKQTEGNSILLTIRTEEGILRYLATKGSIAIDGVSLTIAYLNKNHFKINLIPLSKHLTTLGHKNIKDIVNIECDIIAKYTEKLLNTHSGISMEFLKDHGFSKGAI